MRINNGIMKRFLLVLLALMPMLSGAQIRLPRLVGDNMVLQRESRVHIWGWAPANDRITVEVSWNEAHYTVVADAAGAWSVEVPTPAASACETVTISDNASRIELKNVAIGEVWICSGQSNMAMSVGGNKSEPVEGALEAILTAGKYPDIRLFRLGCKAFDTPQQDCISERAWRVASADDVVRFSAVAYSFGRTINDVLDVPVGLIATCWGGSRVESWMTRESIEQIDGIDHAFALSGKRENHVAANLYNGMIAPLTKYKARGFIWYQGEDNVARADDYDDLMAGMVRLWREQWGDATMPFYYVLLAPYAYGRTDGEMLPRFIESQVRAKKLIPFSGFAATVDLGNAATIHPGRKMAVGQRLAFMALRNDYKVAGMPLDAPTFKSVEFNGDMATVKLDHIFWGGNGIAQFNASEKIVHKGFEIAGQDRVFYPAQARLTDFDTFELSSDKVKKPIAVRYGFYNVPDCNVATCIGQPLVPFRTDSW